MKTLIVVSLLFLVLIFGFSNKFVPTQNTITSINLHRLSSSNILSSGLNFNKSIKNKTIHQQYLYSTDRLSFSTNNSHGQLSEGYINSQAHQNRVTQYTVVGSGQNWTTSDYLYNCYLPIILNQKPFEAPDGSLDPSFSGDGIVVMDFWGGRKLVKCCPAIGWQNSGSRNG